MLGDDHSHMGGSGDMKSVCCDGGDCVDLGLHIYVSVPGLGFVHFGIFYILYVTLSRLIVLYPRCRVNRDTNLSVVCVLCNFNFCFHCAFGLL